MWFIVIYTISFSIDKMVTCFKLHCDVLEICFFAILHGLQAHMIYLLYPFLSDYDILPFFIIYLLLT